MLLPTRRPAALGFALRQVTRQRGVDLELVLACHLARHYSGADVVGTPPEFAFVAALDLTVRRKDATESLRPVVAGGTMMVSRECLGAPYVAGAHLGPRPRLLRQPVPDLRAVARVPASVLLEPDEQDRPVPVR